MSTARQWDILNKPELDRIALELSHYQNLLSQSGGFLLPEVVESFKTECVDEIKKAEAASAAARKGILSYLWSSASTKSSSPILTALDALSLGVKCDDRLERLKAIVNFLNVVEPANAVYHDRLIVALIKKHPNCPARLASQPLPEEAVARVKESFLKEAKRLIEISKSIPKPPPVPNKEKLDEIAKSGSKGKFNKIAECELIDELREKFKSRRAAIMGVDALFVQVTTPARIEADSYDAEVSRLYRIEL